MGSGICVCNILSYLKTSGLADQSMPLPCPALSQKPSPKCEACPSPACRGEAQWRKPCHTTPGCVTSLEGPGPGPGSWALLPISIPQYIPVPPRPEKSHRPPSLSTFFRTRRPTHAGDGAGDGMCKALRKNTAWAVEELTEGSACRALEGGCSER